MHAISLKGRPSIPFDLKFSRFLTGLHAIGLLLALFGQAPWAVAAEPENIADLKALEQKIQAVAKNATPCVVGVSGGSGVIVSEDGLVLTVAHVGEHAARRVTVTLPDGRRVRARTLGNDHGVDAGICFS